MGKVKDIWMVQYKYIDDAQSKVISYDTEEDAIKAKQLIDNSHRTPLYDGSENVVGNAEVEYCTILKGKRVQANVKK